MQRLRRLSIALLAAASLAGLPACGSDDADKKVNQAEKKAKEAGNKAEQKAKEAKEKAEKAKEDAEK